MSTLLQSYADEWKNENDYNTALHAKFTELVNADPELKAHRDWVEQNQHGFGDRPFHYLWHLLVDAMPQEFSFLEVGVFKGQIISLVTMLAERSKKKANIWGITTLSNTEDTRCKYPDGDYQKWITQIYDQFMLPMADVRFIVGKSSDEKVLREIGFFDSTRLFDMAYIDGGHDFSDVCNDILHYGEMVKPGGLLVMDDASINRLNIGTCWPGLDDVSRAVAELIDKDDHYKFLMACGHINVFQRI